MISYITKKIIYAFFVLWGVITVVFFLFNILPGDSSRMLMGQRSDLQTLQAIRHDLGLDKSIMERYAKYLNDLSPLSVHSLSKSSFYYFDSSNYSSAIRILSVSNKILVVKTPYLQRSFQSKKTVSSVLSNTFFNTLILALVSIFLASVIGIILGVWAALYKNSWYDRLILVFTSMGMALPSFFAAILFAWLFAYKWSWWTHLDLTGNLVELDDYGNELKYHWKNLILPSITLGIRPLSVVLQLSRNAMLDVLSQDYIRTAKAKGLSSSKVIFKHALKNAMNPVITSISGWLAGMLAGVVFVEYIFGWKGLGYVVVEGVNNYDIPIVIGVVINISIVFVIITLLVDLLYVLLDPRVKLD